MCGLAGRAVIGSQALPPDSLAHLRNMSHAVAHRGPEGESILVNGPVGLAFRRLALVTPNAGGQPILDVGENVALIANGEVYNHRDLEAGFPASELRTGSDCEVLAHLYLRDGLRFLDEVIGMFALVLHDRRRNRLIMARDRFGIKPLYYARCGDAIIFGSEIKALLQDPACPRELDWPSALADQALHGAPLFSHEPVNTWLRGIEIVPAGTIISIDLGTGQSGSHQYWRLPDFSSGDNTASDEEIVASYRDLLAASVADCVTAEADVGLFLSGGVDSSAVAALAMPHRQPQTFSVLTGSTLTNGDAEAACQAAAALGLSNHQLIFDTGRVPQVQEWKRLVWLLETPLCGPEQYYKYELYRFVKRVHPEIKGMLLGQASDEFNGGYSAGLSGDTGWTGFLSALSGIARSTAVRARPALACWLDHHDDLVVSDELLREAASPLLDDPYQAFVAWKYRDIQQYNCWHEDRTAAGNGVEARVPFLDHRIVELLASIPASRHARLLWDKQILRRAVRDLLPAGIAERPKVSFYHGSGAEHTHRVFLRMLAQDNGAIVEESLAAPGAREYLRPDVIRSMLASMRAQPAPTGSEFILRLVNMGLLDQMIRDLPAAPVDTQARELPPAASLSDWADGREAISAKLLPSRGPAPGSLVRLADEAMVVHTPTDADTLYIVVNGQFEYVVDGRDDPQWCAFLRHLDGSHSLAEVADLAGIGLDTVSGPLRESMEAGILIVEPGPNQGTATRHAATVG